MSGTCQLHISYTLLGHSCFRAGTVEFTRPIAISNYYAAALTGAITGTIAVTIRILINFTCTYTIAIAVAVAGAITITIVATAYEFQ
jgi:hypothetical protein